MVEKFSMSMGTYAFERLMREKPPRKNRSEWIEELILTQLDAIRDSRIAEQNGKQGEKNNALIKIVSRDYDFAGIFAGRSYV